MWVYHGLYNCRSIVCYVVAWIIVSCRIWKQLLNEGWFVDLILCTIFPYSIHVLNTERSIPRPYKRLYKLTFLSKYNWKRATILKISATFSLQYQNYISPKIISHDIWDWDWDWAKFIQHNMTLYRCMISDIHNSSYVLFSTNMISNTSLHVGRPLLRPFLVAYAEATLARQKR